jgi:Domain of unknown function (DUF4168)
MRQQTLKPWIVIPAALAFSCGLLSSCGGGKKNDRVAAIDASALASEKIAAYAESILEIEPIRAAAYENMKIESEGKPPQVACNRQETVSRLRGNIKKIAVQYCTDSKKVVEENQLTVQEFNALTQQVQESPEVNKQVQSELIRLRKS